MVMHAAARRCRRPLFKEVNVDYPRCYGWRFRLAPVAVVAPAESQAISCYGRCAVVHSGTRYQVKRITVSPGARLSVQMHHHRAEHWIVVSGTAKVTRGTETFLLAENQSTYIPVGEIHSLENPGVIPLELIEVQSGSYLGEDDIVRLNDRYGRS
nr:cupin domain-containing protein [Pseudomonas sp. N040]